MTNDLGARFATVLDAAVAELALDHLVVALSGGRDSVVLCDLASVYARARGLRLHAAHVDHGLHADSASWARDCVAFAAARGVPCSVLTVDEGPPPGASVEAWARTVRYARLASLLERGSALLTAHHADDQAETVLQRVLAGAGPYGLAGMPGRRPCGRGMLLRPLLAESRAALAAHAEARALAWTDDPANRDPRFVRNRVRAEVLPALEQAVAGSRAGLLRLGAIQSDLAAALDAWCDATLGTPLGRPLAIAPLRAAAPALRPYLLRRWLVRAGAPVPGRHALDALVAMVALERADATPVVRVGELAVRRFAGRLHLTPWQLPTAPSAPLPWAAGTPLALPWGRLVECHVSGERHALAPDALRGRRAEWRFRTGGERLRQAGHAHHHTLKHLLQHWGVAPWERGLLPLLFLDDRLAAVPGYAVAAECAVAPGEQGIALEWTWDWPDVREADGDPRD